MHHALRQASKKYSEESIPRVSARHIERTTKRSACFSLPLSASDPSELRIQDTLPFRHCIHSRSCCRCTVSNNNIRLRTAPKEFWHGSSMHALFPFFPWAVPLRCGRRNACGPFFIITECRELVTVNLKNYASFQKKFRFAGKCKLHNDIVFLPAAAADGKISVQTILPFEICLVQTVNAFAADIIPLLLFNLSGGKHTVSRHPERLEDSRFSGSFLCTNTIVFLQLYLHHLIQENLMIQISRPIVSAPLEFIRRCKDKYSIFNCISTAYSDLIPQIRDL